MNERIVLKSKVCYDVENPKYICVKTPHGNHISNMSGKLILDCLYDGALLGDVIEKYQQTTGLDYRKSVVDVWEFLSSLKTVGILDFDENYFQNYVLSNKFNVSGELEYQKISDHIIKNFDSADTLFSSYKDKKPFNVYLLRNKGFNHKELYFYSETNSVIHAVIGIANFSEPDVPLTIVLVQGDDDELLQLFMFVFDEMTRLNRRKIRIVFPTNSDNRLVNILQQLGFFKEGELIEEDGKNNYFICSKILKISKH